MAYELTGQSTGAVGAIVLLITGVGVSILVLIFVGALGGQTYNIVEPTINDIANNVVTAQSFIAHNATAQSLGHTFVQSGTLAIYNATGLQEFGLGNFTIDYTAGTVQLVTAPTAPLTNGTALAANFTWGDVTIRNNVKAGITSGFNALEQTGNYLPILVLAIVITLVLGLVLGFTAMGGGMGGRGSAL